MHLIGWLSLHCLVVFFLELWSVLSFGPVFFSWRSPNVVRGRGLGVHQGRATHVAALWCCVWGGGVWEGTVPLALLTAIFSHFSCYPQANWAILVLIPLVDGFVYILGPCGSLQWTLLWGFSTPTGFFSQRFLKLYYPVLESWVAWSVLLPSCCSWFVRTQMWDRPLLQLPLTCSSSHSLATSPLCPGCLAPPLLLVWMYVSSLTPWSLDFHTVQFSGSSGVLCFFCFVLFCY